LKILLIQVNSKDLLDLVYRDFKEMDQKRDYFMRLVITTF